MENDRPPILGMVGRESGQIRLTVCENTQKATIQPQVETYSGQGTTLYTDENSAYDRSIKLAGVMLLSVIQRKSG